MMFKNDHGFTDAGLLWNTRENIFLVRMARTKACRIQIGLQLAACSLQLAACQAFHSPRRRQGTHTTAASQQGKTTWALLRNTELRHREAHEPLLDPTHRSTWARGGPRLHLQPTWRCELCGTDLPWMLFRCCPRSDSRSDVHVCALFLSTQVCMLKCADVRIHVQVSI